MIYEASITLILTIENNNNNNNNKYKTTEYIYYWT